MGCNQNKCLDDIFTEENVVLSNFIGEDLVEEIESYPDDMYKTYYHLCYDNDESRLCFSYESKYVKKILHLLRHGYIAVYLDFITEVEEKNEEKSGISYSFDIVTPVGLATYIAYLQNIRGVADGLLKAGQETVIITRLSEEKTELYISIFDYSNLYEGEAAIPQLMPLQGMIGIVYNGKPLPNPHIPVFPRGRLKLQVNNVGQGNWNEVLTRKKTRLVYDIGTYKEKKSRNDVKNLIDTHQYTRKPTLILSHWDLDHYNLLLFMTLKELKQFSQLIVTTTLPSLTPFRFLQKIVTKTKVQLSMIDNNSPLLTSSANYIDVNNQMLKLFVCRMTMSSKKLDLNKSGLLLDVDGSEINYLMTGDATYGQASDAIKQSYAHIKQDKDHYLIIPHHGGGHHPKYILPACCKLKTAILSVDELKKDNAGLVARHRYGHPTIEVVFHFIKEHKCKLLRTDYANEDILLE